MWHHAQQRYLQQRRIDHAYVMSFCHTHQDIINASCSLIKAHADQKHRENINVNATFIHARQS